MNYEEILGKAADVLTECQVRSFPIDCFQLLTHYGYRTVSYRQLKERSPEAYEMCASYSEDALSNRALKLVAYNERRPRGRIRFSLMHELGHILLDHYGSRLWQEREANFFASHILAPRIAVHYAGCKNCRDVADAFGLTLEAGDYAFQDYRRWRRIAVYHRNALDRRLYQQFHDQAAGCFVYRRNTCAYCGKEIVNSTECVCGECDKAMFRDRQDRVACFQEGIPDDRLYEYLTYGS